MSVKSYKQYFQESFVADPDTLWFTPHSHGRWSDAACRGHEKAKEMALFYSDDKWEQWVFGELIPEAQLHAAQLVGLHSVDASRIACGPNTHHLFFQVMSRLLVERSPLRILTTDSEFASFESQIKMIEDIPNVHVERVPLSPHDTFVERFNEHLDKKGAPYDLVFLSHTFYTTGFTVPDLSSLFDDTLSEETAVIVDGCHSVGAMPVNIQSVKDKIFYLWTSYKYGMGGEGACFMHIPQENKITPLFSGWMKDIKRVISGSSDTQAHDFWGATFDPSGLSRFVHVMRWMEDIGITLRDKALRSSYMQDFFRSLVGDNITPLRLSTQKYAGFLSFEMESQTQTQNVESMLRKDNIRVDTRGRYIRIGFDLYHDMYDVVYLSEAFKTCHK